jgi:pimeloyl-ACP methyl ester carboxylesterase
VPFLPVAEGELFYEVHGSGPPLVLAHGLGGGFLSWFHQVPHFRSRFTCVVFSHRGFAPSRDHGGKGPHAFVDDFEALVDHLKLTDMRIVGQSMGGWTAIPYCLRHPERVRGLVMACSTGPVTTPDIDREFTRLRGRATAAFMRGVHPACGERMLREQPAVHELYRGLDVLGQANKLQIRDVLLQLRVVTADMLKDWKIPTLCLTADEDTVCAPEAVESLSKLLPGSKLIKVPTTGHSVYFERPTLFNRILDEFLASL